jgi:hypothetical protein
MDRTEYEDAVDSFLGELSGIVGGMSDDTLMKSQEFFSELNESISLIRDHRTSPVEVLRLAVGIVDEFLNAHREKAMSEAHAFYLAQKREP